VHEGSQQGVDIGVALKGGSISLRGGGGDQAEKGTGIVYFIQEMGQKNKRDGADSAQR
jgi:hypothetical protein